MRSFLVVVLLVGFVAPIMAGLFMGGDAGSGGKPGGKRGGFLQRICARIERVQNRFDERGEPRWFKKLSDEQKAFFTEKLGEFGNLCAEIEGPEGPSPPLGTEGPQPPAPGTEGPTR